MTQQMLTPGMMLEYKKISSRIESTSKNVKATRQEKEGSRGSISPPW
jgi:hypothetical protein